MLRSLVARVLLATACCTAPGLAEHRLPQDPPPTTATPPAPVEQQQPRPPSPGPLDATTQQALERLSTLLAQRRTALETARAGNDLQRVAALGQEVQELEWQFGGLAARFDVKDFEVPQTGQTKSLQQEIEALLRPLLEALKNATAEPRQVADLQYRIEQLELRQRTAEDALRAVERTRNQLPATSPAYAEAQREIEQRWRPTIENLRGELWVLKARLLAKEQGQKSLVDSVSQTMQNFVQSSGISLLLAVAVFASVFVGLRWLANRLLRRRRTDRAFSLRLLEVVVQVLILLVAIAATLVVPYSRNDWLLLAVCIVFLLGIGWALVKMLPQFVEQIRLVLNIGGVREGERILVDGLPYRVDALRFYSRLHNPDLEGGELRVPIQHLIGKRSRRSGADEPWFPTRTGDVVLLADGVFGTVRTQTPDVVVVEDFGAQRSYPTATFLAQNPRNLSGGFVLTTSFGVDYSHQAEAVTTIPARLQEALTAGLTAELRAGELQDLRVELQSAGTSSLDYIVHAAFAGSAASRYLELRYLLQSLFVAACTRNGWRIPFPQLTVHRAPE